MKRIFVVTFCLFFSFLSCHATHVSYEELIELSKKTIPVDATLSYGELKEQVGDLRLPTSRSDGKKLPLLIIIHGGGWQKKIADRHVMASFAKTFCDHGIATWNIEYRCVDDGGGWPNTFLDVGQAIDFVKTFADRYNIDLNNVVVVGHSAGGHLALWSAMRHKLQKGNDLFQDNPLTLKAVVNLAGPGNLKNSISSDDIKQRQEDVLAQLLGTTGLRGDEKEAHYRQASPFEKLPLKITQRLITGTLDIYMSPTLIKEYYEHAKSLGDDVDLTVIDDANHFDIVVPGTPAWSTVERVILDLFK